MTATRMRGRLADQGGVEQIQRDWMGSSIAEVDRAPRWTIRLGWNEEMRADVHHRPPLGGAFRRKAVQVFERELDGRGERGALSGVKRTLDHSSLTIAPGRVLTHRGARERTERRKDQQKGERADLGKADSPHEPGIPHRCVEAGHTPREYAAPRRLVNRQPADC